MRASRTFQLQTVVLLYLTTFAAAWPIMHWPRWMPELDSLVVRQDSSSSAFQHNIAFDFTNSNTGAAKATATSAVASQTGSNTESSAPSETASNSGGGGTTYSITKTGSTTKATGSGTKATTSAAKTTSYDARLPAGGVSLMTPAIASGSQYYKIGDYITFAWNYTSLSATPTAVNVMATCKANAQLYTIASNLTISANNTQGVVWDTGAYQATAVQNPLLTQTYTLIIYDAGSSISAVAQAGYLAVYNSYSFGMYTPQAYTPLGEFSCATCSGALSESEKRVMGLVLGMGVLTVASFTWFVGGTGVIW